MSNGADLAAQVGGKPHRETFAFAEQRLVNKAKGASDGLQRVYMVGGELSDNIGITNDVHRCLPVFVSIRFRGWIC